MKVTIEEIVGTTTIERKKQAEATIAEFAVQHLAVEQALLEAKGDVIAASAAGVAARVAKGTDGQALVADSTQPAGVKWADIAGGNIGCLVQYDEGGGVLTTGEKADIVIPVACSLLGYYVVGQGGPGSAVIDLWHCSYSDFDDGSTHPVNGDSVTNSNEITISSAHKTFDADISADWTDLAMAVGDVLRPNFDSLSAFTRLSMLLIFSPS